MIIDADTHISPIRGPLTIPAEELICHMDRSGVNKAVCWLQPPYMRLIDDSLQYLYQSVKKYPDRLLGFGWVDQCRSQSDWWFSSSSDCTSTCA